MIANHDVAKISPCHTRCYIGLLFSHLKAGDIDSSLAAHIIMMLITKLKIINASNLNVEAVHKFGKDSNNKSKTSFQVLSVLRKKQSDNSITR